MLPKAFGGKEFFAHAVRLTGFLSIPEIIGILVSTVPSIRLWPMQSREVSNRLLLILEVLIVAECGRAP